MENQQASSAARRRINMIATHLQQAATDQEGLSLPNLLSVNCSSTFNSGITRGDNRLYFARQGSSSQAFFMRQVSQEQDAALRPDVAVSLSQPAKGMSVTALNRLMYSRPETLEKNYPSAREVKHLAPNGSVVGPDHPKFAKPSSLVHDQHDEIHVTEICNKKPIGNQWSPKMDIVETQSNYVVTVEVPGTGVDDTRVEVNNQSLVVFGKRENQWWNISACSDECISRYHTRGIQQGPYRVEWPLPADANKDTVSAQFVNGILQITIPKLQACCA